MRNDFTGFLWLLKLGAIANLYFLAHTFALRPGEGDPHVVIPAQILFVVSAYRCVFPNRYKDNIVLHGTVLSSTLVTRALATFVEVAWIYQFAYVLRLLNRQDVAWVDVLSWLMVLQVVASQVFVWSAILVERIDFYFYEELGWLFIFLANTVASGFLYSSLGEAGSGEILLQLNLLFGVLYLPWQCVHLRALRTEASEHGDGHSLDGGRLSERVARNLHRSSQGWKRATDAASWGGFVGLVWMIAYWASLIPLWVHQVVTLTAVPG